ncbi:MAG: 23S rRNA pseudouridine synthase [Chloroflexi bacterium]|nr:MAG: 23S rRNA pseudouridine synthase [Chloroflexota bacterium]
MSDLEEAAGQSDADAGLRLQVALARAGVASRRGSIVVIESGRVAVNGAVVRDVGVRVDLRRDSVSVDGEPLGSAEPLRYFALHKPPGVLSAASDDRGRKTVTDFLPADSGRCVPVGRLDLDSEGLLLLSNDGPLIDGLIHPRAGLQREYLVELVGHATDRALQQIFEGVELEDGIARAKPKRSKRPGRPGAAGQPGTSWIVLVLTEGRKREVRRMCEAVGYPVMRLIRVRFGPILLRDLEVGAIRPLAVHELRRLRRAADLESDEAAVE